MLGILTEDHDMAFPFDYLALLAHGLDRRTNFHFVPLLDDECTSGRGVSFYCAT